MKNNKFLLSVLLIISIAISLLILIFIRTFLPAVIIPKFNVVNLLIVSLIAIVINYYITEESFDFIAIAVAFIAFGVLPFVSGFVTIKDALLLALKGGATFTVAMFIFSSIQNRISTSGKNIYAPVITAIMLILAAQCLMGIM